MGLLRLKLIVLEDQSELFDQDNTFPDRGGVFKISDSTFNFSLALLFCFSGISFLFFPGVIYQKKHHNQNQEKIKPPPLKS